MKFVIYIGKLKTVTVEAEDKDYVKAVILDNAKTFLQDMFDDGVIEIEQEKLKELKKRIRPIQVEWLKSLLPQEEADKITVDNVEGLLPEDNYMKGIKGITLVFMSDRWLLKQLKKYPEIKTYNKLKEVLNV